MLRDRIHIPLLHLPPQLIYRRTFRGWNSINKIPTIMHSSYPVNVNENINGSSTYELEPCLLSRRGSLRNIQYLWFGNWSAIIIFQRTQKPMGGFWSLCCWYGEWSAAKLSTTAQKRPSKKTATERQHNEWIMKKKLRRRSNKYGIKDKEDQICKYKWIRMREWTFPAINGGFFNRIEYTNRAL